MVSVLCALKANPLDSPYHAMLQSVPLVHSCSTFIAFSLFGLLFCFFNSGGLAWISCASCAQHEALSPGKTFLAAICAAYDLVKVLFFLYLFSGGQACTFAAFFFVCTTILGKVDHSSASICQLLGCSRLISPCS